MTAPLLVIGDALLDVDVVGAADRLTPDAPVPVVRVDHETTRPGGAGLAALLAARLVRRRAENREVVLVTPVARDAAGEQLRGLLADAGVRVVAMPHDGATPVKRRIRAGGQSVARLDEGGPAALPGLPDEVCDEVDRAGVVLVSDYGQGTTRTAGLRELLAHRPVVWDPHPRGADPVPGAQLVTPSAAEATQLAPGAADDDARAAALVARWDARAVAVTLGRRGALLSRGGGPPIVVPPPAVVDGGDSCGAGDCFAASAALALAGGEVTSEAVQAGVADATRFVAAGGAAALDARDAPEADDVPAIGPDAARRLVERVRATGGSVVATGGCFDLLHAGHVATLRAARSLGDCLVVLLNSDASVRRLKGPGRPIVPETDRARVLAALDAVDAVVVFDEDTPERALRALRPDTWTKGGDYSVEQLSEAAVLEEWGGRTVLLPYLDGRSTTRLVATAAGS